MPDWTQDRTTDLTDPFILRRDGLNPLDVRITAGGGGGTGVGGRTVTFSQAAGAPSITGGSPKFIVPFVAVIQSVHLAVVSAPQGSPLTVEFQKNGVAFTVLQIEDGDTTTQTQTESLPAVGIGDELTVESTSVGSSVAAQGITALMELGS